MGIDFFWKFFDCVFIGNISDHHGGSGITKDLVRSQKIKASLFKIFVVIGIIIGGIIVALPYVVVNGRNDVDSAGMAFLKGLILREHSPKFTSLILHILI